LKKRKALAPIIASANEAHPKKSDSAPVILPAAVSAAKPATEFRELEF
jgi:hypothetical protein